MDTPALGAGVRINGGWQISGLQLPSVGTLRALGFAQGSIYEAVAEIGTGFKVAMASYEPASKIMMLNVSAPSRALVALETSADLQEWTSLKTNTVTTQTSAIPPGRRVLTVRLLPSP